MRQGSVLYMGALAKHIAPDDPKIVQVVHKLLDTLGTPSEQVQRTVSAALTLPLPLPLTLPLPLPLPLTLPRWCRRPCP